MDYNEFQQEHIDSERSSFDFRGFLFNAINLWKYIVLFIAISLLVAYFINLRQQNVYRLDSLISIENEQNPFFTANTSISFNWGGVSGKVGKVLTTIKTRSHNELVVDSLQFYMQYLKEGKYHMIDIYKKAPFTFVLQKELPQLLNKKIGIRILDAESFEVFTDFEGGLYKGQRYATKVVNNIVTSENQTVQRFLFNQDITLPFLNGKLVLKPNSNLEQGAVFYLKFLNFDAVVNNFKNLIQVNSVNKTSASILKLSLTGPNKSKIVDYLNCTSAILSSSELKRKNLYATNTIKFIDSTLARVSNSLQDVTAEMNAFRRKNKVFDVDDEIIQVSVQLKDFDKEKQVIQSKLNYLNSLETYLNTKTDYTMIAAPTSVGIEESNILSSVGKITNLAIQRQNLEYTAKEGNVLFKDLDRQIDAEKNVLLETLQSTKSTINIQLNSINKNIIKLESELSNLPEDQQEYLKIQRKLDISRESYDVYQSKRGEAAIVKAANVSDIIIIDEAKDIGAGLIGPNKNLNYMLALMIGFFTPMFFIFINYLLDNTIHGSEDVERLSRIPILGLVGKYKYHNNLVVFEKPKSAVAESFRAIRSSLQFLYSKQQGDLGRTLMVTSSVSGEGKTFCSINLATAYASSGKKTILLGLDLRKPKIVEDFELSNDVGIVNFLVEDKALDTIICKTHIENLSVIPSGPIPPNPSELLMSEKLTQLVASLRDSYDLIVLDTPPVGLVADALQLSNLSDVTIFMIRLDYTKKGMLQLVNAKHRAGELKHISYVLNFYKHKSSHNYGYGYGYGYGLWLWDLWECIS